MSDLIPATIEIGGDIPRRLVEGLCEAIGVDRPCLRGLLTWPQGEADLLKGVGDSGTLVLQDDEARLGEFDAIERFCVENQVAFDRHSEARYDYNAENVSFRPGMKEPQVNMATADGDDFVLVSDLRPLVEQAWESEEFLDRGVVPPRDENKRVPLDFLRAVKNLLPDKVPPVGALKITD
jgi:hypothetical protein